jgi:hypothetical protein
VRQSFHGSGAAPSLSLALPLLAFILAGCSSLPGSSTATPVAAQSSGSSGSFTDRMNNMVFGQPARPGQGTAPPEDPDCPVIDVRTGASTITIFGPGEQASTNVRYQATIGQTARECAVLGATMTVKVGVQGRILLGPAGGPGKLDVPIRLALVHEGPEPRTIWSKLYRVPVVIPAGQPQASFVHVEEDMTFPMPKGGDLESYIIYVGFDQLGAKEQPRKPRRAR